MKQRALFEICKDDTWCVWFCNNYLEKAKFQNWIWPKWPFPRMSWPSRKLIQETLTICCELIQKEVFFAKILMREFWGEINQTLHSNRDLNISNFQQNLWTNFFSVKPLSWRRLRIVLAITETIFVLLIHRENEDLRDDHHPRSYHSRNCDLKWLVTVNVI